MNLFLFHRDLRIEDNLALNKLSQYGPVCCVFIFTPTQITKKNKYFSERSFLFMCESLNDLKDSIHKKNGELYTFYSETIDCLENILKHNKIERIGFNIDYTPYAKKRDKYIQSFCKKNNIEVITDEDYLLHPITEGLKKDGNPYLIYTPFKDNLIHKKVLEPFTSKKIIFSKMNNASLSFYFPDIQKILKEYDSDHQNLHQGGRKEGLKRLKQVSKTNYSHDLLSTNTTELSAFIKFGCISIREAYYGNSNTIYHQQLLWREFYYYIVYYFPEILEKHYNFQKKYDNVKWIHNSSQFKKWCDGKTGVPIVDACMRQLNRTGYMHNRGRLITANFLNRMLGMDWRLGERYFAQKLVDYDPAVNNGNWQWVSSTGCDPKPYYQRLFNPYLQGERFDKDCQYIKTWIPELKDVEPKHIHQWEKYCENYKKIYSCPIIDYKESRERSIQQYKI
jgi:deoxyribodipyrimidine photo-lyase